MNALLDATMNELEGMTRKQLWSVYSKNAPGTYRWINNHQVAVVRHRVAWSILNSK